MLVIVLENAPARLRGRLSLWMLEIRAGVYVTKATKRHRERLWGRVCFEIEADQQGNAVMAWSTNNEAGYSFETYGENRREMVDFDGLEFISFKPPEHPGIDEMLEFEEWLDEMQLESLNDE